VTKDLESQRESEMRLCVMVLESRERVERIAVIRMESLVCDEFYLREAARQAYAAKLHPVMWPFSRGIE
jgi:hypothetical protein